MAAMMAKLMAQKAAASAAGSAIKGAMGSAGAAAKGSSIIGGVNGSGMATQGGTPGGWGGAMQGLGDHYGQQITNRLMNGSQQKQGMPTSMLPELGAMSGSGGGPADDEQFDIRRQWWKPQRVA